MNELKKKKATQGEVQKKFVQVKQNVTNEEKQRSLVHLRGLLRQQKDNTTQKYNKKEAVIKQKN